MKITTELLDSWNACYAGKKWFSNHFPHGGTIQATFHALERDNLHPWAKWLFFALQLNDVPLCKPIKTLRWHYGDIALAPSVSYGKNIICHSLTADSLIARDVAVYGTLIINTTLICNVLNALFVNAQKILVARVASDVRRINATSLVAHVLWGTTEVHTRDLLTADKKSPLWTCSSFNGETVKND